MPFSFPAIRFEQKKMTMYLVSLPTQALDLCSIDRWDPKKIGHWKGYQRGLVQSKINSLAQYLERADGILPVAGLLNVREKNALSFVGKKAADPTLGTLKISDYTSLYVVDMQHRLEGIKLAFSKGYIKNFHIPVLITEGLSEVNEAAQFYLINTKAKRMGVDLTRRLLIEHNKIQDIADIKPWELKAVQITIILNKRLKHNNPWYERIKEPETEKLANHIAMEKSFVPSLSWLLTAPVTKNKSAKHLARFLANYWEGIRQNLPGAFVTPKDFLIQKTPAYVSFHRLAPIIYRKTKKSHSVAEMTKVFKPLSSGREFGVEYWNRHNIKGAKKYGSGQGAVTALAMDLQKKLGL